MLSDLYIEMSIVGLEVGKYVFCEKLIVLIYMDVWCVVQYKECKYIVIVQNCFNVVMQDLRSKVLRGDFGKVLSVFVVVCWYWLDLYYDGIWQGEFSWSGGVVINQVIYYIDVLLWLVGCVRWLYFFVLDRLRDAVAIMEYESGVYGIFEVIMNCVLCNFEFSVMVMMEGGIFKVGGIVLNCYEIFYLFCLFIMFV